MSETSAVPTLCTVLAPSTLSMPDERFVSDT
jgi:hypothetical protein